MVHLVRYNVHPVYILLYIRRKYQTIFEEFSQVSPEMFPMQHYEYTDFYPTVARIHHHYP